ncbi:MAG: PIG-L deacetylase family protein [Candidatus Curtissbacteria bacterium]|nr:PIG-L deacetylase family protein [Candidatus Curtissbacteria bacterium]
MSARKTIVAVFAHPDDEAFGPSGTIAKFTKTHDVYLLCATKGEAGKDFGNHKNLAKARVNELKKSAKILGVKKIYFLGFIDGTLSNSLYHALAKKIENHLKRLKPETVITTEPRGVSGHIDHITVSMTTSFACRKLPFVKTILYHCITDKMRSGFGDDYFVYFPPGYKKSEIGKIVDVSDVWDVKMKAMFAHKSQIQDAKRILERRQNFPKKEYFLVVSK